MLAIPVRFDPPPWDEEDAHLEITSAAGRTSVTWRTLALTVTHAQESFPPQADFEKHTMGLYFHGQFGFSLAKYNEFFVNDLPTYAAFRFGSVGARGQVFNFKGQVDRSLFLARAQASHGREFTHRGRGVGSPVYGSNRRLDPSKPQLCEPQKV